MTLEPLYTIPLVYQLTDPADTGTYYVRSVVKDSHTGDILDSTNLTAKGSGRYTGSIVAPQDSTGFGRHIDIVTSVYTDAGYTIHSDVYALKVDNYVVRKTPQSFGGSIGPDIDYKKIRKIIEEVVDLRVSKIPPVELNPIYERFKALDMAIKAIEMPTFEQKEQDMLPIISAIDKVGSSISKKIGEINIPEQKEPDLSPVVSAIDEVKSEVKTISSEVASLKDQVTSTIKSSVKNEFKLNTDRTKKVNDLLSKLNDVVAATESPSVAPSGNANPDLNKYFKK